MWGRGHVPPSNNMGENVSPSVAHPGGPIIGSAPPVSFGVGEGGQRRRETMGPRPEVVSGAQRAGQGPLKKTRGPLMRASDRGP